MIDSEQDLSYEKMLVHRFIKFWTYVRCGESFEQVFDEVAKWKLEEAFLDISEYLRKKGLVDPVSISFINEYDPSDSVRKVYH